MVSSGSFSASSARETLMSPLFCPAGMVKTSAPPGVVMV